MTPDEAAHQADRGIDAVSTQVQTLLRAGVPPRGVVALLLIAAVRLAAVTGCYDPDEITVLFRQVLDLSGRKDRLQ